MALKRPLLNILAVIVVATFQVCGQDNNSATYKGDKYTLDYPANWQTSNKDGILNFFPKENYGAITISYYTGINFPLEKTKAFILEMYEIKDKPTNVKMTTKGNVTEFYYEHIDKNVKWITKAFRRNTDFYLLTINCDLNKWEANKNTLINTMNSFKIN